MRITPFALYVIWCPASRSKKQQAAPELQEFGPTERKTLMGESSLGKAPESLWSYVFTCFPLPFSLVSGMV